MDGARVRGLDGAMTVEGVRHSPILSALFRGAEDPELLGAADFIKGKNKEFNRVY